MPENDRWGNKRIASKCYSLKLSLLKSHSRIKSPCTKISLSLTIPFFFPEKITTVVSIIAKKINILPILLKVDSDNAYFPLHVGI